jgi:GNAT superfamily N-acetyltransferase
MKNSIQQKEPTFRFAEARDATEIVRMVKELANYEKDSDSATATPEDLTKQLESPRPPFECILVEIGTKVVAFALFFQNYSTWQGKPGMYLEDLHVQPDQRGSGIGKRLLHKLGDICRERGYGRMEWQALSWNQPALDFYKSLGAESLDEWRKYRVSGEALQKL